MAISLTKSNHFKLPTAVLGAAVAADGQSIVAGCMDGVFHVDLASKQANKIGEHSSYVSSARILSKHNSYVTAGYDGCLQWFDIDSHDPIRQLNLHSFWSWDMAVSPDQSMLASVTGQYLSGGYKYEPLPEREPSVKVISTESGEVLREFSHVPSVQATAFSPDNQFVAAGNLMGEIRVWNCHSGKLVANWTTPDFTSWGIIKSHCYLGGIFAIQFAPDSKSVLIAGMGPMRDPMAGNGRQLWQHWSFDGEPKKIDETHKGESGEGLMETLCIHPSHDYFVMGGRLRGGDWNVALFDLNNGNRIATLKTGYRVTEANFTHDGQQLILVGTQGQPGPDKNGKIADFGRVEVYDIKTD